MEWKDKMDEEKDKMKLVKTEYKEQKKKPKKKLKHTFVINEMEKRSRRSKTKWRDEREKGKIERKDGMDEKIGK